MSNDKMSNINNSNVGLYHIHWSPRETCPVIWNDDTIWESSFISTYYFSTEGILVVDYELVSGLMSVRYENFRSSTRHRKKNEEIRKNFGKVADNICIFRLIWTEEIYCISRIPALRSWKYKDEGMSLHK